MQDKHSWEDEVWNSIDWQSFGSHFKYLPQEQKTQHTKIAHDQKPTGHNQSKISKIPDQ
jgi:hypothetical protein